MEDAAEGAAHRAADQEGSAGGGVGSAVEDDVEWRAGAAADNGGSAALAEDAAGGAEDDGDGSAVVAADVEDSAGRAGQAGRAADNGGSAADGPPHRAADQEGARLPLLQWMWRMRRVARHTLVAPWVARRTTTGRGARAQAVVLGVKLRVCSVRGSLVCGQKFRFEMPRWT